MARLIVKELKYIGELGDWEGAIVYEFTTPCCEDTILLATKGYGTTEECECGHMWVLRIEARATNKDD